MNEAYDYFSEFLILDRTIKMDLNVKAFLKIFDKQSFQELNTITSILESPQNIDVVFNNDDEIDKKTQTNKAIGAIKFAGFISQLRELLDSAEEVPVLQSAIWSFYGFYFETMNLKMIEFYTTVFKSLTTAFEKSELFNLEIRPEYEGEEVLYVRKQVNIIIAQTREDIHSILDFEKYARPLQVVVQSQLAMTLSTTDVPTPVS